MLGRAVQLSFPVQAENEAQLRDSCTAEHYLNMCLHPSADEMSLDQIREANKHGQYLWGDYRMLRLNLPPDLRLLNMETALTTSIDNDDIPWEKGINYHFHLDNFEGVWKVIRMYVIMLQVLMPNVSQAPSALRCQTITSWTSEGKHSQRRLYHI